MSFLSWEHEDALRSMVRRARVVKVDDSGTQQKMDLRGLASDQPQKIVRIGQHGFTSHAPKDSEGLLLALGGRADRLVFLGGEHKDHRQKDLKAGQSVLYDDKGNVLFLKGSDGISIKSKDSAVQIQASGQTVTIDGANIYLGGDGSGGGYSKVMTEAGPSANVFAKA